MVGNERAHGKLCESEKRSMSGSILAEIRTLRNGKSFTGNNENTNRFRILANEANGTCTSYFFSAPIYNINTGELVKRTFSQEGNLLKARGSNAEIVTDGQNVTMYNHEGSVTISMAHTADILPTLNGVAVKYTGENGVILKIKTDKPYKKSRNNQKYFSIMKDDFTPFLTVSAIGVFDESGEFCCPAKVHYSKIDNDEFSVFISTDKSIHENYMFEMNLYEQKLFRDTTVESKNFDENNIFGGMGFIGRSDVYGRQWLYIRLDAEKVPEIISGKMNRAILHIPKYNNSEVSLTAYNVASRFCTFASNWRNKVKPENIITEATVSEKYYSFDITRHIFESGGFKNTNGFVIKAVSSNKGYAAIATGDNYFTPLILEMY